MSGSCDPMDCSLPGSSVHGISQQEYWSGFPFSSPGDLSDPGIEPGPPAQQTDSLPTELPGKPWSSGAVNTCKVVTSWLGVLRQAEN